MALRDETRFHVSFRNYIESFKSKESTLYFLCGLFHYMQVTISLLPVSLSLVHIPCSRLVQLSHPVLKQILQPNPTFLNITCNEIELSLFADETILEDFEPIARRDRQRAESKRKGVSANREIEPVEISSAKWSVIQIDSHGDQIGAPNIIILSISRCVSNNTKLLKKIVLVRG